MNILSVQLKDTKRDSLQVACSGNRCRENAWMLVKLTVTQNGFFVAKRAAPRQRTHGQLVLCVGLQLHVQTGY